MPSAEARGSRAFLRPLAALRPDAEPSEQLPPGAPTKPQLRRRGAWGDDAEEHTCFQVDQVQGTVKAAAEDALAAGGPPGGPHRLAVQGVGLQAAPRVHSVPHLRGKHSARHQTWGC